MTRAIRGLLGRAAQAALSNDGVVPTDIAMELASEGYDLDNLDMDVERILTENGHG
jgi:hypothetical protein